LNAAKHGKAQLSLTRTEFAILECLIRAAGRVVTRARLIDLGWGDKDVSYNNLEVFIRFLRQKVEAPGQSKLIHTERGIGYSLREKEC
jgi:DNA-binding response OmpR family regulator